MKAVILIALLVLASACSNSGDNDQDPAPVQSPTATVIEYEDPAPSTSYAEAYAAAVAAMEASAARGHAWSTAGVLLEQGAAAAADGDDELAIELADKARIQADLSVRQADFEESAWVERVLSD